MLMEFYGMFMRFGIFMWHHMYDNDYPLVLSTMASKSSIVSCLTGNILELNRGFSATTFHYQRVYSTYSDANLVELHSKSGWSCWDGGSLDEWFCNAFPQGLFPSTNNREKGNSMKFGCLPWSLAQFISKYLKIHGIMASNIRIKMMESPIFRKKNSLPH